jgi:ketosteroid isomerase-like protein
LRQHGAQFSGSIGADQNKQSPLRRPVYKDGHIRFAIESVGHKPMSFDLRLDQGKLVGDAEGDFGAANARADLSLERSQSHVLYEEIAHMDDVMFDAFNAHDLETLKGLFTEDLEFYHDKDGLTNYTQNMEAFKEHFAGKTRIRRELDEATLEVYPLKDFGAIEVGVHRFYTTEPGETEKLTATAKFVHVWTKKDGMWKVKRVVSYDHE